MRTTTISCFATVVLRLVLLALAWLPCIAAIALDVQTSHAGKVIEVRAQAVVHAPLAVVWATLTDYERLPQFIPGMKTSRVLARKAATVTVAQTGEAHFLFFTLPIDVTVESTEQPPYAIVVQRVAGSVRQLQGRYDMQELTSNPAQVQLRWTGSIEPESNLPPLIGNVLMRSLITEQFVGLVREIERRAAAKAASAPVAP
jgi:ribosome-associated toxin RatA of RatAB toxin-antitoxin module